MQVEKVSRYVTYYSATHSTTESKRRILLSLPRVKWLERDPEYVPPPPIVEAIVEVKKGGLTASEATALGYKQEGLKTFEIGQKMGLDEHTVRSYISSATRKMIANGVKM